MTGATYGKGDFIGQNYEVHDVLGNGSFGIVYLVYSHVTGDVLALKTFPDKYLADSSTKERLRREAGAWVDMERHPHLVRAHFVEEIAGRLFVAMEHIAPDRHGLNTLEGYLRQRPPDLEQSLRWAIQFCYGMEYAYSRGIRCHRDIRPANIMIGQDKAVRITDFGLAGVLGAAQAILSAGSNIPQSAAGLSGQTMDGTRFGAPTYMPPEQFSDAGSCDERSDIYAFGVVLFQMASNGRLPSLAPSPSVVSGAESAWFQRGIRRLHAVVGVPKLESPLLPAIRRCMEKEPEKRYHSFGELRGDLALLLRRQSGETVAPPELSALAAWELYNKGANLHSMGRDEEAIRCIDKALELNPRDTVAWSNRGNCLDSLGRHEEAINCYDRALAADPHNAGAWRARGAGLNNLCRYEEAIRCFDEAMELDPRQASDWRGRGTSLEGLGRHEEALRCLDKALEFDPRQAANLNNKGNVPNGPGRHEETVRSLDAVLESHPQNAGAPSNEGDSLDSPGRRKEAMSCCDSAMESDTRQALPSCDHGNDLYDLGRYDEAIRCFDEALELDPREASSWFGRGSSFRGLGRYEEAARCYEKALECDPHDPAAWTNLGNSLYSLGRVEEAVRCYDNALELDPQRALSWYNMGNGLFGLGRVEEAIRCYDKALELDPRDAMAWYARALAEEKLDRHEDAVRSFRELIALAPNESTEPVEYARQRVREFEGNTTGVKNSRVPKARDHRQSQGAGVGTRV